MNGWVKIQCSGPPRGSYIFTRKEGLNLPLTGKTPSGKWEGKENNCAANSELLDYFNPHSSPQSEVICGVWDSYYYIFKDHYSSSSVLSTAHGSVIRLTYNRPQMYIHTYISISVCICVCKYVDINLYNHIHRGSLFYCLYLCENLKFSIIKSQK